MIALLRKIAVAVAVAAGFFAPCVANADFVLRIDGGPTGASGYVIADGGVGDLNPAAGVIQFNGILGSFTVGATVGLSKPVLSDGSVLAALGLANLSIHGSGAATIRFTLEDTGFGSAGSWVQSSSTVGSLNASLAQLSAQYFVNTGNFVPDLGVASGVLGPVDPIGLPVGGVTLAVGPAFVTGPGSFSSSPSFAGFTADGQFSMFQQVVVTFDGEGVVGFGSKQIASVPEPETYALLFAGLGLLGVAARRRIPKIT